MGSPDIPLCWMFDLHLSLAKLLGRLCGATLAVNQGETLRGLVFCCVIPTWRALLQFWPTNQTMCKARRNWNSSRASCGLLCSEGVTWSANCSVHSQGNMWVPWCRCRGFYFLFCMTMATSQPTCKLKKFCSVPKGSHFIVVLYSWNTVLSLFSLLFLFLILSCDFPLPSSSNGMQDWGRGECSLCKWQDVFNECVGRYIHEVYPPSAWATVIDSFPVVLSLMYPQTFTLPVFNHFLDALCLWIVTLSYVVLVCMRIKSTCRLFGLPKLLDSCLIHSDILDSQSLM